MKTYTIRSAVFQLLIVVEIQEGCGLIKKSNLKDLLTRKETEVIERLILAHACAGIDIGSQEYLEGIESTIDGLENSH